MRNMIDNNQKQQFWEKEEMRLLEGSITRQP